MKALHAVLALLAVALLLGCGSTRIRTSDNANYAIYVDDVYKGEGEVSISSMGPPRTAVVEARQGDRIVGSIAVQRRIEVGTIIWGCFSYFTALYWAQYYPDVVIVPIAAPSSSAKSKSSWDAPLNASTSSWDRPIE